MQTSSVRPQLDQLCLLLSCPAPTEKTDFVPLARHSIPKVRGCYSHRSNFSTQLWRKTRASQPRQDKTVLMTSVWLYRHHHPPPTSKKHHDCGDPRPVGSDGERRVRGKSRIWSQGPLISAGREKFETDLYLSCSHTLERTFRQAVPLDPPLRKSCQNRRGGGARVRVCPPAAPL